MVNVGEKVKFENQMGKITTDYALMSKQILFTILDVVLRL